MQDIANRFQAVEMKLRNEPLTWIDEQSKMPASFTNTHLRGLTFQSLYGPTIMFPILASVVSNLHEGIIDELIKQLAGNSPYFNSQPFCGAPLSRFSYSGDEAGLAVMCSDKRHPVGALRP